MSTRLPSLEFLLECSDQSLCDLVMKSYERAAGCTKRAKMEWEEAVENRAIAETAQWIRENRENLFEQVRKTLDAKTPVQFPQQRKSA